MGNFLDRLDSAIEEEKKKKKTSSDGGSFMERLDTEIAEVRRAAGTANRVDANSGFDRQDVSLAQRSKLKEAADKEWREQIAPGSAAERFARAGLEEDGTYVPKAGAAQLAYEQAMKPYMEAKGQFDLTKAKEWAGENKVKASAASVGTAMMSGADFAKKISDYSTYGEILPGGATATDLTQGMREAVSKDMSKVGRFVYNTAMSGADSLAAGLLGSGTGALILGLGAASSTANDIKARGGSDEQALIGGAAAGVFESIFEKLSLGELEAMKEMPVDGVKTIVKNLLKSVVTNASEEAATEIANIVTDRLLMKELSNYELAVKEYMAQGDDQKRAEARAYLSMLGQIGEAALSGGLMGAGFSAIGSARGAWYNRGTKPAARPQEAAGAAQSAGEENTRQTEQTVRSGPETGETGAESVPEGGVKENAAPAAELDGYPNLQKMARGESVTDANAAATEAMDAIDKGLITREQGREMTRQAVAAARDAQTKADAPAEVKENAAPAEAKAAEVSETEPTVMLTDGRKVTRGEFVAEMSGNRAEVTEARAGQLFDEALELNRQNIQYPAQRLTGQKTPGFYGNAGKADRKYLDRLAKAAGVSIERAPAGEAGSREGWIIGGRVYISEGSESVDRLVAKHEVTHYLKEMAPEAYKAFRDYVENIYKGRGELETQIERLTELYRRNGEELTAEQALDELASNYAGELLDNEALIRKLAGEDRSIGRRILDGIRDILRRLRTALGDEEVKQLDRAARLWEQALEETNRAYYKEGKRAVEGQGEEAKDGRHGRSSVKGARELQQQIDRLARQNKRLKEQMKRTGTIRVQRKAVEQQAAALRKAYGSKMDKVALADRLEKLYGEMAARSSGKDKGGMSWTEIKAEARAIADDLLTEARGNVNPLAEEYADLRREIRGTKLTISPYYRGDFDSVGGYEAFRKRNMGTLKLGNEGEDIGTFYESLSEKNADMFPIDIVHPADQLIRISDVMEDLKAVEGNPFENDFDHTAEYLAGEIEERFYDMPSEKPTLADKMEDKYHRQRIKDQEINAARLYAQQKAHERELRGMEKKFQEENRKRIENQNASERRRTIVKHAERLGKKLLRPSDKQHIPDDMRGAVLAFVRYLDLESGYETVIGPDGKTKRVQAKMVPNAEITSRTAAARELQAQYRLLEKDSSLSIDPDMADYLDEIAKMGEKKVANMTRAELDTVWKVMQVIEHTISRADDILSESQYRKLSAMAEALREENGGKKDRTKWDGVVGAADKMLNVDMLSPETYLGKLGKVGRDLWKQMRGAADRQTVIIKEGTERAAALIKGSGVDFNKADKEMHTFELDDGEITLSTGQLMELYALSKREAALEHIYLGGLKPVDVSAKGKILGGSKPVKVTPLDVADMIDKLTPEQKKLMDGLQAYMSGDLAKHGNEESQKVYGYSKFTEKNYWPIKVSRATVASDPGKAANAKTIPGYGMTKSLQPHAKNAVELRSAIDTYSSHLNQMATYAAWLGTSENITRLYNYTYMQDLQTPEGETVRQKDGTVKELLEKVYGADGGKYIENLLADIAQGTKAGADKSVAERGLSQFKAAKVGANLRVIIQQPTAILRAMEMVDPKYFASGKTTAGKGWEKAVEYSPIAQWKDWGYFELDTGRSLRELMTGTASRLDKVKNAAMYPAGWMDSVAWGYLWNAVEAETADKHPELDKGSRAFYEAVAERFGEVVDRTQVVDTVLHRSQIMRSSNYLDKISTSFMSEPTKVYNMVVRDLYELASAEGDEARKKAAKRFARTSAALITSFAVNALAQSLVDGLRDDDREKGWLEKSVDKWLGNFADNFNPVGYIPVAKDVLSLAQGYTLERSEMEGIADVIAGMQNLFKATQGESQKTVLAAGLDAASKLGDMIGLPVSNLKRDAEAILRSVLIGAGAGKALYRWDKLRYSPEKAMGKFYDDMYRAMDTDQDTYELIYDDVLEMLKEETMQKAETDGKDLTEEEAEEEAASKIKSNMESRMKKALGLEKTSSLPVRYSAPGEDEEFDRIMEEAMENDGDWAAAIPEDVADTAKEFEQQDPEKTVRVLTIANAGMEQSWAESMLRQILSDKEMAQYTACKKAGVTLQEWAEAYNAIGGAVYQRTKKRGTHTQEDVETALNKIKGLDRKKKTAIWNSYGWKAESPWS